MPNMGKTFLIVPTQLSFTQMGGIRVTQYLRLLLRPWGIDLSVSCLTQEYSYPKGPKIWYNIQFLVVP